MTLPDDPLLQSLGKLAREQTEELAQLERRCRDGKELPRGSGSTKTSGLRPATDLEARATAPFSAIEQTRLHEHVRRHLRPVPTARVPLTTPRALPAAAPPGARGSRPGGQQPALKVLRGDATPLPGRKPQPPLRVAELAPAEPPSSILDGPSRAREAGGLQTVKRTMAFVVPLCAAAAAAVLWFSPTAPSVRELPAYSLDLVSAPAEYRSSEPSTGFDPATLAKPIELPTGARLVLSLRPATTVVDPVQTRVIVRQASGSSHWPATVETSPHGAVRLQLDRSSIGLRGPAELIVLIGHGETPPPTTDARALGWQRWSLPVILSE